MTFSLVAHAGGALGVNGGTTSAIDTTGANLLYIAVSYYSSTTITLTDSAGNTFTAINGAIGSGAGEITQYYCASPKTSASHTFTVSGSTCYASIAVQAWSGAAAAPLDQSASAPAAQPGSITPSQNNCLVCVGCTTSAGPAPSVSTSGWTVSDAAGYSAGAEYGGGAAYQVQTTAAAADPLWSGSGVTVEGSAIASFLPGAGGIDATGLSPIPDLTLAGTARVIAAATGLSPIPDLTLSGTARAIAAATGLSPIPDLALSGTATHGTAATGLSSIPDLTLSGAARAVAAATGLSSIPDLTLSGTARAIAAATGLSPIPDLALSGTAHNAAIIPVPPQRPATNPLGMPGPPRQMIRRCIAIVGADMTGRPRQCGTRTVIPGYPYCRRHSPI